MMMDKEASALALGHKLTLEGRNQLSVTGVTDVESFDELAAVLETARGTLVIRGSGLHVVELDLEAGNVRVKGEVDSLTYEENKHSGGGFLDRLFR